MIITAYGIGRYIPFARRLARKVGNGKYNKRTITYATFLQKVGSINSAFAERNAGNEVNIEFFKFVINEIKHDATS